MQPSWANGERERMTRSRPHDEAMTELYRSDPALALEVIQGIVADGDHAELPSVLRKVAQAFDVLLAQDGNGDCRIADTTIQAGSAPPAGQVSG